MYVFVVEVTLEVIYTINFICHGNNDIYFEATILLSIDIHIFFLVENKISLRTIKEGTTESGHK